MVAFSQVKPQALKLRAVPQYPVQVRAEKFLTAAKANGILILDVDYSLLGQFSYSDLSNKKFPVLDTITGQYGLLSIQDAVGGVTSFAGLTGDVTLGYGLSMSLQELTLNDMINVRNYGAVGNALTGGTNDTAAFNLAIVAQGITATKPIYLPKGEYLISTATLDTIYGSVYGPEATIVAADINDSPVFHLHYRDNGAETSTRTFNVRAIQGFGYHNNGIQFVWPNRTGSAIYVSAMDMSEIKVMELAGFKNCVWLDGGSNEKHFGTNHFDFRYIHTCDVGILMNAGAVEPAALQENNKFNIGYMQDFTTAAIYLGSGGTNDICDNVFHIGSLTPNHVNGDGIVCTQYAKRNEFNVRSWDAGVSGTGRIIRSTGANNWFRVPYANHGVDVELSVTDILDTVTSATDGTARSRFSRTSIPTVAGRQGDICTNRNIASGQPMQWGYNGSAWIPGPNWP